MGARLTGPARRRSHRCAERGGRRVEASVGRIGLHGRGQVDAARAARLREHGLAELLILHARGGQALHVLRGQVVLAVLLALSERHVERLGAHDAAVHVGDGFGGLLRRAEADEAEALGAAVLDHDLGAGDGAEAGELLAQALVVNGVVQVLDVQVDAHVAVLALLLLLLVHLLERVDALELLLEAADKETLARRRKVGVVELVDGGLGRLGLLEVDEAVALALAVVALGHHGARDLAVLLEHLAQLLVVVRVAEVLDVDVGELLVGAAVGVGALIARHEAAHVDLLVVEQHVVHVLDGRLGRLIGLEVHEAVAARVRVLVDHDLARQDVAERGEGVVESLVVDALLQVLDEHVAHARLAQRRIALRPHDAHGSAHKRLEVHRVEGALGIGRLMEVHVGVAERLLRDLIAAHADREHLARGREALVQLRLSDVWVKIAYTHTHK